MPRRSRPSSLMHMTRRPRMCIGVPGPWVTSRVCHSLQIEGRCQGRYRGVLVCSPLMHRRSRAHRAHHHMYTGPYASAGPRESRLSSAPSPSGQLCNLLGPNIHICPHLRKASSRLDIKDAPLLDMGLALTSVRPSAQSMRRAERFAGRASRTPQEKEPEPRRDVPGAPNHALRARDRGSNSCRAQPST